MNRLSLQTYIEGIRDPEGGRYRILAGIQDARSDFNANRLYPTLAELVELYRTLTAILEAGDGLKGGRGVIGLDLANRQVLYRDREMSREELVVIEEAIRWSLPHLEGAIEEGRTIHNFVEEQAQLEEVGLVPSYIDEGYLLVPDLMRGELHVIRYEMSIIARADERYRGLKTTLVRSLRIGDIESNPWSIKQHLMRDRPDLPNPATYSFETEYDFPFEETLLPIAKRKLLTRISRPN